MVLDKADVYISKASCDFKLIQTLIHYIEWNGRAYINHKFFWESIGPIPSGGYYGNSIKLREDAKKTFGDFPDFVTKLISVTIEN